MKIRFALAGILTVLFMTARALAGDACTHVTLEWISSQVPLSPDAKIVLQRDQGDFCEVVLAIDGNLAPVYAGRDSLVAGRLFKQGIPVTRQTIDSLSDVAEQERKKAEEKEALAVEKRKVFFKTRIDELAPLVSMSFQPGQPKDFLYVITDPDCSHCKALKPELEEVAFEAGLALKLIIYPVLGTKSRDMAFQALCNGYSYEAYKEMALTGEATACEKADDLIGKTEALLRPAGISFVPLVVASDGSWVVEGNDICQVRTHLGLEPDKDEQGSGKGCAAEQAE
ncbi:MAG: thioredoxin fold domain-containing protein [Desulfobacterales bacterium]|nr:thioredoxin fold domain-containing protein [Desulfobacterales bacterium]